MPQIQNPTAKGDRVLRKSLVGASTETLTLSAHRAQHLIANIGARPDLVVMVASLSFGGQRHG